jgi:hypothetical protein
VRTCNTDDICFNLGPEAIGIKASNVCFAPGIEDILGRESVHLARFLRDIRRRGYLASSIALPVFASESVRVGKLWVVLAAGWICSERWRSQSYEGRGGMISETVCARAATVAMD